MTPLQRLKPADGLDAIHEALLADGGVIVEGLIAPDSSRR